MSRVVVAIDLGTTGSRAIAFSKSGAVAAESYREFPQYFPKPGWVEHDPQDYLTVTFWVLRNVLRRVGAENVVSIGVTNQRETTIVWDRRSGRPVYPAIVWQDRRTEHDCRKLVRHEKLIRRKTGLRIDPYFSATKIAWILNHVRGARERAEAGRLVFGTPEVWLLWHLTGRRTLATDPSNASRTLLFDIHTLRFDPQLCAAFKIPRALLPEVRDSDGDFGQTLPGLTGKAIPVRGVLGDQQAALFAQAGSNEETIKNTYGTGIFLLKGTGPRVRPAPGLVNTVAWKRGSRVSYALEGSVFMAGSALQWLRDHLKVFRSYSEVDRLAGSLAGNEGVYFVPAFQGLGAPYWAPQARAVISGLTRRSGGPTLVRAALEAMAYQTRDVIEAMRPALSRKLESLRVDGGVCRSDFLMQFQADLLGVRIERPQVIETTALGAAMNSALASGFWSEKDLPRLRRIERVFRPSKARAQRESDYKGWRKALAKALGS